MRARLLAALALLPPAARICGSSPPCDADEGSCGARDAPASEPGVGLREAEEAAALRVELLQKSRLARRGFARDSPGPSPPSSGPNLTHSPGPSPPSSDPNLTHSPGPSPPSSDPGLTRASQVCVSNNGGFKLSFELWDTATNQRTTATDAYAAGGQDCLGVGDIPMIEGGDPIVTVVYISAGATITLIPIIYDPDLNETAALTCTGGTGTPKCTMDDAEVQQLPPPKLATWQPVVKASEICLTNNGGYRLSFQVWNTAWDSLSSKSDTFDQGSSKCISGDFESQAQEGNPLVPITYVQGGLPLMFHSVLYDATASAASYVCGGATGGYSCKLMGT